MSYTDIWGIDFYPTPQEVIDRMLAEVDVYGKFVLEPSAGSGNIVDALNRRGAKVCACEIDARLRKVLSGKCSIIAEDFMSLTSEQVSHIDFIVMNPPFSKAAEHILHAYEIAPEGCEIISLCNSEMLSRIYTQYRKKIVELIDNYGFSDNYGSCFAHAERSTDCSISCIHLWKPRTGASEFDGYLSDMGEDEACGGSAGLMPYNSIRDIVNRYVERQQNVPFTMRNVFRMLEMIVGTHGNRMEKTLVEAFDKICSFSAENSTAGEKWKTNSDYMINRRFIVPRITNYDERWPGEYVSFSYWSCGGYADDIEDVIRALCYVTGTPYERTCTLRDMKEKKLEWGKWHTMGKVRTCADGTIEEITGFFRIRGYKKGTMHFEFLDEDVWAKFNLAVAKIKGWQLPKERKNKK